MTTNYPEVLDDALIRPGRIDTKIKLGRCTSHDIVSFFDVYFIDYTTKKVSSSSDSSSSSSEEPGSDTTNVSFEECRAYLISELERVVSDVGPSHPLLSPAHVSCVMQHYKECPWKAARSIIQAVVDHLYGVERI